MTTTPIGVGARKVWDVAERALKTYLQVFLGLLLAADVFDVNAVNRLGTVKALAVSAIPMGLSVVTSAISLQLGNRKTASVLPAELDPATKPDPVAAPPAVTP